MMPLLQSLGLYIKDVDAISPCNALRSVIGSRVGVRAGMTFSSPIWKFQLHYSLTASLPVLFVFGLESDLHRRSAAGLARLSRCHCTGSALAGRTANLLRQGHHSSRCSQMLSVLILLPAPLRITLNGAGAHFCHRRPYYLDQGRAQVRH